jgi:hypothetical protein
LGLAKRRLKVITQSVSFFESEGEAGVAGSAEAKMRARRIVSIKCTAGLFDRTSVTHPSSLAKTIPVRLEADGASTS